MTTNLNIRRDVVVPYQHSVDTWSLGAVLFHLLCASPPFEASADHQGEMMLLVIMNSNLNWNKVRRVGVSDKGIDFLSRMLVTEPSQRASDEELLHHSWIIGQNGRADPSSLEELAASQLSIADGVPDPTSGLGGYDDGQEEASYDWRNEETIDMTNPPPPNPLYDYTAGRPAVANRLFGEITNSALRSSGVLGENAHSALQMTGPGSYDPSPSGSYIQTRGGGKEFTSAEIAEASRLNSELSNLYNEEVAQSNTPQEGYPLGFSSAASSLLGAEALVDQLNMASPDSGNSLQSGGTKPATPKTSHRELMPAPSLLKRFSRDLETDVAVHHSKRFKSHHAESQSSRVARPSIEQSGQDRSVKNNAGVGGHGTGFFGHNEPSAPSHYSPVTRDFEPHSVDQQFGPRASDSIPESRRASDNQHTSHIPLSRDEEDQIEADRIIDEEIAMHQQELAKLHARKRTSHPGSSHSNTPSIDPNPTTQAHSTTLGPSTNHVPSANTSNVTAGKEFAEPRSRSVSTFGTTGDTSKQTILYGTLTPVKGSVHTLPEIQIREPNISFGRATNSTFIHPDGKEDRVPLRCFYIQMRYKGIDADIAAGIKELYKNPDITAVIGTRTKHYIKVNGVRLEAGKDCWQYGNLKTGDVITVFEPPEGQKARSKKDLEFLKFECEFYVGKSMQVRRATDPFKVEEEKSKYQEYMRRKKPGSEASERSKASEGAKAGEGENSNEGGKTTIIEGGKPTEGGKASEGTTAGSSSASGAKQGVQSS